MARVSDGCETLQLSAARVLFDDRLSIGIGLVLGSTQLTLSPESANSQAEDLLSSSGTTALACLLSKRHYIAIEQDAKYFEAAKRRLEQKALRDYERQHLDGENRRRYIETILERITTGVVSAYRTEEGTDFLQFSAPVSPGSSGGPVVDHDGAVLGVTTSKITEQNSDGLSFAVTSAEVCRSFALDC